MSPAATSEGSRSSRELHSRPPLPHPSTFKVNPRNMPTHFTKGVKAHLVTASLAATTTTTPEAKKSSLATRLVDSAGFAFRNGQVLDEENLPVNGDDFRLHYLGKYQDMPFMMVRAGAKLFQPSPTDKVAQNQATSAFPRDESRRSNPSSSSLSSLGPTPSITPEDVVMEDLNDVPNTPEQIADDHLYSPHLPESHDNSQHLAPTMSEPQGICLRVELSTKSYVLPFNPKDQTDDIKIDVFFNGQFTQSSLWPARWSNPKSQKDEEMTKQFTGERTHYLLERAWVILPGTVKGDTPQELAQERWNEISATLKAEADARGTNEFEERTVIGDYLVNLADVQMPHELDTIYLKGRKFGVIDMVLTFGKGKKRDAAQTYLLKPTRMNNPGFISSPIILNRPIGNYLISAIVDAGIDMDMKEFGGSTEQTSGNRKSKDVAKRYKGKVPMIGMQESNVNDQPNEHHRTGQMRMTSFSYMPNTPLNRIDQMASVPSTQESSGFSDSPLYGRHTGQMHMAPRPESIPFGPALLSQAQNPETPGPPLRSSVQRIMSPSQPGPASGLLERSRSSTLPYSLRGKKYQQQGAVVEGLVGISGRGIFTDASSPTARSLKRPPSANIQVPAYRPHEYPQGGKRMKKAGMVTKLKSSEFSRHQQAGPSSMNFQHRASAKTRSRGISSASAQSYSGFSPPIPEQNIGALNPGDTSPTPYQKRRMMYSRNVTDELEQSFKSFVTPPLSQNCVLTYAQPRSDALPGVGGAGGCVVRQIKCERQGDFEEKGVLLGVRFIVG
ncbi:uncharacterized protein K452DRAFT_336092 [Aplosporella prunicola CBS 121167]|uniref:Uncharacterized protein n=1 Tax=Aplosporella prunicola CBS 121167 TaxID=1176127 RepID=A0A6A6B7F6_9PEZI|nr:uncharacterized protein K452DRAFT_336092 [Aplosporella prunicola CBS 121167]KAF2140092.1 hypothetical protein K452DRAFT_336092 [Aplosporella prunicola CBS 121167]